MFELGKAAGPKVLLVDDEPRVLDALADLLRRDYHVFGTTNPGEAQPLLATNDIALLIADQQMPAMTGSRLLALAQSASPLTVRVLLTGSADFEALMAAVNDGGIFRCAVKPWDPAVLLEIVRAATEQYALLAENRRLLKELARTNLRPQWLAAARPGVSMHAECKQVLENSLDSLRALTSAVEQSSDAVMIWDREGRVEYVNPAFERQSGYSRTETVGQRAPHADCKEIWDAVLSGRVYRRTAGSSRKNGETYHEDLAISPLADAQGRVCRFMSQGRDISERARLEEQVAAKADELARANAELEQFAYVVSHDLQEPLRMVASYTQILGRRFQGKLDKDADEFIFFAVDGARRMQNMIKELLDYSRISRKGRDFARTDCSAVVQTALTFLRAQIQETKGEVTCGPLPAIFADAGQIERVFLNLIGNALKFHGAAPPVVSVSVERKDSFWQFTVRDNGIGIDPQFHDRVFVIFQRLHTQNEYAGSGMGLSIAKRIVERHRGRIWIESEPGKGAAFHFTIPADMDTTPGRPAIAAEVWKNT